MRRVHRSLDAQQVKQMRDAIASQLPASDLPIGKVIRDMRISIKRSQEEYAKLCGVAPRALADIEAGAGNPTIRTLRALLLPFACDIGVVRLSDEELRKRRSAWLATKQRKVPSPS
jgi:transcriptional regulator with XRE-family HTH domain